jgi:hypothetical protein
MSCRFHAARRGATLLAFLAAAAGPAAAAELQAYAGAVGGIASGTGGPFACSTSGPTIGQGWFAGITLPTEGFAACNLSGGIDNQTAATGPLFATQSVNSLVGGGSFSGQASARADYGRLGAAASGTMTGASTSATYRQTAGFARFQDTLTLSQPGIATGTPGTIDFAFLIDGVLKSTPNAPYTQQGDVALGIRVGSGVGNPARGPWYSFLATVVNDGTPYVRGGGTGLPGAFILGPGSLQGSADVLSTAGFGFTWGQPLEIEVAFYTSVSPCCFGTSLEASFLSTARLTGIVARANGQAVTSFSVVSASGTLYGPGGVAAVPEPATAALWLVGVLAVASHAALRRRRAA